RPAGRGERVAKAPPHPRPLSPGGERGERRETTPMPSQTELALPGLVAEPARTKKPLRKAIQGALESKKHRQPFSVYRKFVQHHYDGIAGKLTRVSGFFSGHEALAGRVFKPHAFDLRGCRRILDAGCGDGRYTR